MRSGIMVASDGDTESPGAHNPLEMLLMKKVTLDILNLKKVLILREIDLQRH